MVVLTYLFNLLCAVVSCEGRYSDAQISPVRVGRHVTEDGYNNGTRETYPIVWTENGGLQGYTQTTTEGREVWAFESIQYGEAPVGNLRFRSPVPAKPWKGRIRRAMKPSPHCLQMHALYLFRVIGQEDCLYLNVYTPKLPSNSSQAKLPVLVMIHGGSFVFGSSSEFGAAYLLNQDIVYVSINYRLGALGFLSTGDEISPGNYGLKDQALALNWIKSNIEKFGGDPSRLFLFGFSAGGVASHQQYLYNKDIKDNLKGLITLSGNSFVHWGVQPKMYARILGQRLARLMRCPSENSQEMMTCLRGKNPARLAAAQLDLFDLIPFPPILFLPTVEVSGLANPDAFITEMPEQVYERGDVPQAPWISSVTTKEGYLALYIWQLMLQTNNVRKNFDKFAPGIFNYRYLKAGHSDMNLTEITEKIKGFYFKGGSAMDATRDMLSDIFTNRYFTASWGKAMQLHAKRAPAYSYILSYNSSYTSGKNFNLPRSEWGPAHGEDIQFFTNMTSYIDGFKLDDPEYKLSKILINIMTNFLNTGKPTYSHSDTRDPVHIWDPITPGEPMRALSVDRDIRMVPYPFMKSSEFWESLGLEDTTPMKTEDKLFFSEKDELNFEPEDSTKNYVDSNIIIA